MRRRLGMIVRADFGGGLANQSFEAWQHLHPDATLVMGMPEHARRGVEHPDRYPHAHHVDYYSPDTATMEDFLNRIDVLFSIETFYVPFLLIRGGELGIERILYANPELLADYDPAEKADRYLWAATWQQEPPTAGDILPWPCSMQPPRERALLDGRFHFVHVAAPAMLDRNGTSVVEEACRYLSADCVVDIYGQTGTSWRNERVEVNYCTPVASHHDLYADADVLVLPRRYGCLSLPMLEAAALGIPTLTTALRPQSDWFDTWARDLLIPSGDPIVANMKGGRVGVHQPNAARLALAMDHLAGHPELVEKISGEVHWWACNRSWPKLLGEWEAVLR